MCISVTPGKCRHRAILQNREYVIPIDQKLISSRAKSEDNRGKGDVNRIYGSKEAYLGTLYDVILGYIDQNRFITMEKAQLL